MELSKAGKNKIDRIPGDDGWWKDINCKYFYSQVQELMNMGFSEEDAIDIMSTTYHAVASEFGN